MMSNQYLEAIVGTYEELSLGYILQNLDDGGSSFVASFTDHSHTASVRTAAISSNGIAATGSADETIKLFNIHKRVELGSLIHHQGSVTGLSFFGDAHMFSWSEDGTICVWQLGNWECLRTLHGHKSAVYSFAVHPSGKLALSCSKDKTLRTWNLITGRCAYVSNIKEAADIVLWSPDGSKYITVIGNRVDVYSFETATVVHQIQTDARISSVTFLSLDVLALGCEKGMIVLFDIKNSQKLCELNTGTNRVKAMIALETEQPSLLIASSDGFIQLYCYQLQSEVTLCKVTQINTGFRLLCAAACLFPSSDVDGTSKIATTSTAITTMNETHGTAIEHSRTRQKKDTEIVKKSKFETLNDRTPPTSVVRKIASLKKKKCKSKKSAKLLL
jgi:protein MAK11